MLGIYEIDDGEQWLYCAESESEAMEMYLEPLIGHVNIDTDSADSKLLPVPMSELRVSMLPMNRILNIRNDEDVSVSKTVEEWAKDGKGCVGGTVW